MEPSRWSAILQLQSRNSQTMEASPLDASVATKYRHRRHGSVASAFPIIYALKCIAQLVPMCTADPHSH